MGHVADHPPRGPQIEQQRRPVLENQQVVRCDVPVVDLHAMHVLERIEHGCEKTTQPAFVGHLGMAAEKVLQRRSLVQRHRHIGSAVLLPEAKDFHQSRMLELRQHARFVDEALEAGAERLGEFLRTNFHGSLADPCSQLRRHVLLDRDAAIEQGVHGFVDDAEAAFADHTRHLELLEAGTFGEHGHRGIASGLAWRECLGVVAHVFSVRDRILAITGAQGEPDQSRRPQRRRSIDFPDVEPGRPEGRAGRRIERTVDGFAGER